MPLWMLTHVACETPFTNAHPPYQQSLGTDKPDLFLGLLQSAFIVGFSLAALVFGHAVHHFPPFRMVGCGLAVWVVANLMSGLAKSVGSYEFLFAARMLSGVGEASFQVRFCCASLDFSPHTTHHTRPINPTPT